MEKIEKHSSLFNKIKDQLTSNEFRGSFEITKETKTTTYEIS